jgi:hypothetical protein
MTAASSTKLVPLPRDAGEIDLDQIGPQSRAGSAHIEREQAEAEALKRTDGRTLRRKGRTETLSTKVKPETIQLIQRIAAAEGKTMVEVLEWALELLDRHLKGLPPPASKL